ncbi:MAG: 50S ribosomal protein L17 [bacterium]
MRHRKRVKKLSRTASHRRAVLANLATALIDRERIRTTDSMAKEGQRLVEKLISKAKEGTLHARRQVLRVIKDKKAVAKLFDTIAPRYTDRNGGYVRLIKVGNRPGDGAALSIIELIGSELVVEESKKAKKRRKKMAEEASPAQTGDEQEGEDRKEREAEPDKGVREETPSEGEVRSEMRADTESPSPQKGAKGDKRGG